MNPHRRAASPSAGHQPVASDTGTTRSVHTTRRPFTATGQSSGRSPPIVGAVPKAVTGGERERDPQLKIVPHRGALP